MTKFASIANTEWEIIDDVRNALEAATVKGQRVFPTVRVTSTRPKVDDSLLAVSPMAAIVYVGTEEDTRPENEIGCILRLELTLANRIGQSGPDESEGVKEGLRLLNAAKNALENDIKASSTNDKHVHVIADGDFFAEAIVWGTPVMLVQPGRPWVALRITVALGYLLASATVH